MQTTESKKFLYCGVAPRLIKCEMQENLEKKHRYGKDDFITIVKTGKAEKDATGQELYYIAFYKQVLCYPVVWKKNVKEVLDFLKNKENNQTINGNKTPILQKFRG